MSQQWKRLAIALTLSLAGVMQKKPLHKLPNRLKLYRVSRKRCGLAGHLRPSIGFCLVRRSKAQYLAPLRQP